MTTETAPPKRPFLRLSIRLKTLIMVTFLLLVTMSSYLFLASTLTIEDRVKYIFDLNASLTQTVGEEVRSSLTVLAEKLTVFGRELARIDAQLAQEQRQREAAAVVRPAALRGKVPRGRPHADGDGQGLPPARDPDEVRHQFAKEYFAGEDNLVFLELFEAGPTGQFESKFRHRRTDKMAQLDLSSRDLEEERQRDPIPLEAVAREKLIMRNMSVPPTAAIFAVAVPVPTVEGPQQVMVAAYQLDKMLPIFTAEGLFETYLVDSRGSVMAHRDPKPVLQQADLSTVPIVRAALDSHAGSGVLEFEQGGEPYLGGFRQIDLGRLAVISQVPKSVAFATTQLLLRKSFLFAVAIVLGAFLVSIYFSRRLTRPIRLLAAAAQRVGAGDFKIDVQVRSRDEIGDLASSFVTMGHELDLRDQRLAEAQAKLIETEKLRREMEIAATIQTSILPKVAPFSDLLVAASMHPADDVGGDYFDILPLKDGRYILAMGDVSGHGLTAGLLMLIVQAAASAVTKMMDRCTPADVLRTVNAVLVEDTQNRMNKFDYMTLCVLSYEGGGRFVFSGAHEDIILYRAAERRCETVTTSGTWVGMAEDIDEHLVENVLHLERGDTMVLYSDGLIEAMNASNEQFGVERVCKVIEDIGGGPPEAMHKALIEQVMGWMSHQDDDITVMVITRA